MRSPDHGSLVTVTDGDIRASNQPTNPSRRPASCTSNAAEPAIGWSWSDANAASSTAGDSAVRSSGPTLYFHSVLAATTRAALTSRSDGFDDQKSTPFRPRSNVTGASKTRKAAGTKRPP